MKSVLIHTVASAAASTYAKPWSSHGKRLTYSTTVPLATRPPGAAYGRDQLVYNLEYRARLAKLGYAIIVCTVRRNPPRELENPQSPRSSMTRRKSGFVAYGVSNMSAMIG